MGGEDYPKDPQVTPVHVSLMSCWAPAMLPQPWLKSGALGKTLLISFS